MDEDEILDVELSRYNISNGKIDLLTWNDGTFIPCRLLTIVYTCLGLIALPCIGVDGRRSRARRKVNVKETISRVEEVMKMNVKDDNY
jgi:hypothetical protein